MFARMRGWIITAVLLLASTGVACAQGCQPPDEKLIKSRGAYTGRADLPDGEKIARYNEQARRFNDCTRKLVDGSNSEIDRVRDEANVAIRHVRDNANRRIAAIQDSLKLAVSGTSVMAAPDDTLPAPACRKPEPRGGQYAREENAYEACVKEYIARASTAMRTIALDANLQAQYLIDGGNARIALLQGTVRSGIETANAAALTRSHAVEGTILGRDDPILVARAAENPLENSKADSSLWPVMQETPSGEGDPRAIVCRSPQPLTESRIMGPKVCRRNGVWAALRQAGKDVAPDGITFVDLDIRRQNRPLVCNTLPGDMRQTSLCN
jgi:hypothetical protein